MRSVERGRIWLIYTHERWGNHRQGDVREDIRGAFTPSKPR
jgi:hypothetical protein